MAFPVIPVTTTLNITATFSPPTTCFPSTPAATYSLPPNSLVDGRLVIRAFDSQCYPANINALGTTSLVTSIIDSSSTATVAHATASFFSAESCPPGYASASGQYVAPNSVVTCCPGGEYNLESVDVGAHVGCVQSPGSQPITLVDGSITTTLETPTMTPVGIAYRPLTIGFSTDEAVTGTAAPRPTTAPAKSGLSSGAQAGIGVGVALGVIALALLGGLLFWSKKRKNARSKGTTNGEVDSQGKDAHELGLNEIVEAPGTSQYAEKQPDTPKDKPHQSETLEPVELEGDWHPVQLPADERGPTEKE